MTTIKDWLKATGRDLDQRSTAARGKLTQAHRVASEKVRPVAHRAAKNVGSAYQAAKPRVEAAVVYATPHVKHGIKYAAIRGLRFIINAERQFLSYVEAHLPKENEAAPRLAEPSLAEPSPRLAEPSLAEPSPRLAEPSLVEPSPRPVELSPVEPVALPQTRNSPASGKNEDDGGIGRDLHHQA